MSDSLRPLRIPTGWTVEWNTWEEFDPLSENPRGFLDEDLFWARHHRTDVSVDVGWYGGQSGSYTVKLMQGNWVYGKQLDSFSSNKVHEIVAAAERFMWKAYTYHGVMAPVIGNDVVLALSGAGGREVLDWYATLLGFTRFPLNLARFSSDKSCEDDGTRDDHIKHGSLQFSVRPQELQHSPAPAASVIAFNVNFLNQEVARALAAGATLDQPRYKHWGGYWYQNLVDPWGNRFALYGSDEDEYNQFAKSMGMLPGNSNQ